MIYVPPGARPASAGSDLLAIYANFIAFYVGVTEHISDIWPDIVLAARESAAECAQGRNLTTDARIFRRASRLGHKLHTRV